MKTMYKSILFVAIAGVMAVFNFSCKESDSGDPYISYVRVINPESKDSLLVASPLGQVIAIIGGNLQNTKEVWFNDQQAEVKPGYVTNSSIVVTVPNKAPTVVTNQIKLVSGNGNVLLYDFKVTISKPVLLNMDCEYLKPGGKAVINGGNFFLPMSVTFPGGVTVSGEGGNITVNADDPNNPNTIATINIPADATFAPGQISVTTNFGTTKSGFWVQDNRNIFQSFDDAGWWAGKQITSPGPNDPPLINGPYYRITGVFGSWPWKEIFNWWQNHNIPDDAILHPDKYNYKFEVNTIKPFNANGIQVIVSDATTNTNGGYFFWDGNTSAGIDTKGEWHTMIFPLKDVLAARKSPLTVQSTYFFAFILHGSNTLDCDMCFDNFRIVPVTLPGSN